LHKSIELWQDFCDLNVCFLEWLIFEETKLSEFFKTAIILLAGFGSWILLLRKNAH